MRIFLIFIFSAAFCAFALALRRDFHPENHGFFRRWFSFFRTFGIPAAIFPTIVVMILYQSRLIHW